MSIGTPWTLVCFFFFLVTYNIIFRFRFFNVVFSFKKKSMFDI